MLELVAAGRRYHNLVRRHGRRRVFAAAQIAEECVRTWGSLSRIRLRGVPELFAQLMRNAPDCNRCGPIGTGNDVGVFHAAQYPNVVALTSISASPYWLDLARTSAGVERILERIGTEVTDRPPSRSDDPFLDWLF